MLPNENQAEFLSKSPIGETSDTLDDGDLSWLLPEIIGDIKAAAASGVFEFQVGVPIECCFDDVENRVAGVVVEPLLLKPGLHNVHLHFYDLVRNSIVFGELRLTTMTLTHLLPFRLFVTEINAESFAHTQVFSEEEQQAWGVETNAVGGTVWANLSQSFMGRLPEFERRARQRPCERSALEMVEQEFDQDLALLRSKREQLRTRKAFLPDPPEFSEAIHRVRASLRQAYADHKNASSIVRRLRELVERGHVRRALVEAVTVGAKASEFTDLDFSFIADAERRMSRTRRCWLAIAAIFVIGTAIMIIISKLFSRFTP